MKLEEGMYVRTFGGNIDKIESFKSSLHHDYIETPYRYLINKKDIKKASYNIIDLIEVGDYVNGYCVEGKQDKFLIINSKDNWCWGEGIMPIEEIKSIVTKEQFESMQYEVK